MTLKTFAKIPSGDRVLDLVQDQLGKLVNTQSGVLNTQTALLAGNLTFGGNFNAELLTVSTTTPSTDKFSLSAGAGWTIVTTPFYTLDSNGWVEVFGTMSGGVLGTAMITGLPPPQQAFVRALNANNAFGKGVVDTAGNFILSVGSTTNVDTFCSYRTLARSPDVLSCFPLLLGPKKVTKPVGVIVTSITDTSTSPTVPALGTPSWTINAQGQLYLTNLPGLLLGRTYSVSLLLVGG